MLLKVEAHAVANHVVHKGLHIGIAQLCLCLALELGLHQLYADYGGKAFPDVVAGEVRFVVLEQLILAGVVVYAAGKGAAEALKVRAALCGVYVVGKGKHALVVVGVVLHGHLNGGHLLLGGIVLTALEVHNVLMEHVLALVQVLHEGDYAALVAVFFALYGVCALVSHRNGHALVEEGQLPHPAPQGIVVVIKGVEYLVVGEEGYGSAGARVIAVRAHLLYSRHRVAVYVFLAVYYAVAADLRRKPTGKGVYHGQAHAVKSAGYLIAAAAELAPRVQHGKCHLQRGLVHLLMVAHGYAAAVVPDGYGIVRVYGDLDMGAVAPHGLVDGVIHQLLDQMVQSPHVRRAYIHAGAALYRLQPLKNLYLICVVVCVVVLFHGLCPSVNYLLAIVAAPTAEAYTLIPSGTAVIMYVSRSPPDTSSTRPEPMAVSMKRRLSYECITVSRGNIRSISSSSTTLSPPICRYIYSSISQKWLKTTSASFLGFCLAENMRFRPGKRAGTDPLRRASGRQNPQRTKTSGFHPF